MYIFFINNDYLKTKDEKSFIILKYFQNQHFKYHYYFY